MMAGLCRFGLARSCFLVEEDVLQLTQVTCQHSGSTGHQQDYTINKNNKQPSNCDNILRNFGESSFPKNISDLFCLVLQGGPAVCAWSFILTPCGSIPQSGLRFADRSMNHRRVGWNEQQIRPRFYCMFVGRLWTEWYPLVPIAALSIFILTASYLGDRREEIGLGDFCVGFKTYKNPCICWLISHIFNIGKLPFCVVSLIVVFFFNFAEFNMSSLRTWGCCASLAALIPASSLEGNWSLLLGHWTDPRNATLGPWIAEVLCQDVSRFTFFHFHGQMFFPSTVCIISVYISIYLHHVYYIMYRIYMYIYIRIKYIEYISYVDDAFDAHSWSLNLACATPRLDKELKELLGSQRCELNAVALVTLATILKAVEEYKHVVLHLHYLHSSFPKLKSQVFGPSMWEAMMFLELGSPLDSSMLFPGKSYFCHFCIASGPCRAGLSIWFDLRTPLPWFQKSWEKGLRTDGMMGRNTISKALKSKANDDYEN